MLWFAIGVVVGALLGWYATVVYVNRKMKPLVAKLRPVLEDYHETADGLDDLLGRMKETTKRIESSGSSVG